MFKKQAKSVATILAATAAMAGMIGCGGGDDGGILPPPATGSVNITRSTEGTFTESARVLAAREAAANGTVWLNAGSARRFDADLAVIRAAYPQFNDITARPGYDLRTIVVAVRNGTPWIANWNRGDATTGEEALDSLLREFAPEAINSPGQAIESGSAFFTIRFGQSLNMVKLAERLRAASSNIIAAEPNFTVGDGNNITVADSGDGSRRYAFSRGSGDCPAGCTTRQTSVFAVSPDGKTATLLSQEGG